jgi:PhoPQ-activated pathogenicity-related protein
LIKKWVCKNVTDTGIAAGTDNQGRETAEFIGSIIGGFLATIAVVAIPIPGIRILAGSTGSYYGGEYAEEIYDYFTNSVQAAQANPQIATDLGIDIKFLYLGYQCQQQYPLAIFRLLVHIKTNPL